MDDVDRALVNRLQDGISVCERPFAEPAEWLGLDEGECLARIEGLLERRVLSRFGPMYDAERLGGAVTLCAMHVPEEQFESVTAKVNALPEVAHNYERDHHLNMWFVLATPTRAGVARARREIESATGHPVYEFPKLEEFYVGLRLDA